MFSSTRPKRAVRKRLEGVKHQRDVEGASYVLLLIPELRDLPGTSPVSRALSAGPAIHPPQAIQKVG